MSEERWARFESYVNDLMAEQHIAGAAVAVSRHGEVIYQRGFGVRDVKTGEPVTPETNFGIASVTKSFTALAIMKLQEAGKLSVHDPVTKYLPEFHLPGADMREITIHHLLSHTTGTPPMRRRQELRKFKDHLSFLASEQYELLGRPGEYFSYCNDTFLLLGAIIETVTGQIYRRHMTSSILDELDMNRSTFSLEEQATLDNVSVPYIYSPKDKELKAVPWPLLGNYEVGGGVRSNVLDLMKYGEVYTTEGMSQGRRFISKDELCQMWQPVHCIGRNAYYGYALRSTPNYSGVTLVEHGGGQPGVSSNFGFVPEEGLAVAVLTNVTGVSANSIWLAAVNTALGLPLDQPRAVEPVYEASAEHLEKHIGTYQSAEGGKITLLVTDGQLQAEMEGRRIVLRASDERTFVYNANGERTVAFFYRADGKPWAAFTGLRMLRRVDT